MNLKTANFWWHFRLEEYRDHKSKVPKFTNHANLIRTRGIFHWKKSSQLENRELLKREREKLNATGKNHETLP